MAFINLCLLPGGVLAAPPADLPAVDYEKATVIGVENPPLAPSFAGENRQRVTVKVRSGELKGQVFTLEHLSSGGMVGSRMILKKGDSVILYVEQNPSPAESPDGSPLVHIDDYYRGTPLLWLTLLFAAVLVAVGGKKGLRSLIGLVITILAIFFVLFPLILKGFPPLIASVLVSGAVSLLVFLIIGGRTTKSLSAALGTLIGVAIAGGLATAVGAIIHLTGLSSEESKILLYSLNLKADFSGILFSGILIGALGAVMDVGMSIASTIDEVGRVHPEATVRDLFNAGMNVGRDVMGTMSNTLILAYAGSALPLLLLFAAGNIPLIKALNMELVAEEIVRALAGSIGLILCVPATALVAATLKKR